jgi:peptidoglycan/LPS O-acetylase OafA/YrhL
MTPVPEIRSLTGLRALPALLVVFFHFYRGHIPDSLPVIKPLVDGGFVAVGMFFVLSGFILTYVYAGVDRSDPEARRAFFVARFARVYPVYALSLVIGFVAGLPDALTPLATGMGWTRLVLVCTLLNAFSHYGMFYLNWAAWSLSAEAFFYFVFPWIAPRVARMSDRALVGCAAVAWLGSLLAPALYGALDPDHLGRPLRLGDEIFWSWYLKFFPLCHLGCFVIGVVAGRLFVRHRSALARIRPTLRDGAAGAVVLAVVAILSMELVPYTYLYANALAPLFALLVGAVAEGGTLASRALAARPLVTLGRASYALYILHVPVFYVFLHFVPDMWDRADLFWPYLGVLVVVALGAYRFVEEPARRWVRRAFASRASTFGVVPRKA